MKAIFIAFNQAYNDEVEQILLREGQRGFTKWNEIAGRGSMDGEPHYGNHAWPVMNHAILSVVPDDRAEAIVSSLRAADEASPDLGLRAFVWEASQVV